MGCNRAVPAPKGRNAKAPSNALRHLACGIDLRFAPSELEILLGIEPRALPWAISFGPFGAARRRDAAVNENPEQRRANASSIQPALKGHPTVASRPKSGAMESS